MMVSTTSALAFYVCFEDAVTLIYDFEGDQRIIYDISLPYPAWLVVAKYGITFAVRTFLTTLPLPFLGKLMLMDRFSLSAFSFTKFVCAYGISVMMFAFFALFCSGFVTTTSLLNFRMRILDPLCFIGGCLVHPWATLHTLWPSFANVVFFNPIVHAFESLRVAFFGQGVYLPFATSCLIMMVWTGIFFLGSLRSLRKRLDYIPGGYTPLMYR
jgi:ABC-type polysaccharide/polyol phosphate export permease